MIAETMDRWTQEWLRQGRNEGRDEGLQTGLMQGLEQQKALVRHLAGRKFGPEVATALARQLESVADPATLLNVASAIVDCQTAAELLDQVR